MVQEPTTPINRDTLEKWQWQQVTLGATQETGRDQVQCAHMSASLSGGLAGPLWWQATRGVTCGGLGPPARRLGSRSLLSSPAVSCVAPWCPPWLTTSASPLLFRASPSWPEYDAHIDAALARLVATLPTRRSSCWASSTKPWLNVSFSGATSCVEPRTPCRTCPRHPSDTLGVSIPDDGDGDDEHPLARKRLKIQALTTTCVDTGVHQGLLQMHEHEGFLGGPRTSARTLGTPRSITRGHGA